MTKIAMFSERSKDLPSRYTLTEALVVGGIIGVICGGIISAMRVPPLPSEVEINSTESMPLEAESLEVGPAFDR